MWGGGGRRWIHSSAGPVGDAKTQQEEGDQWVQQGVHDVAHGPGKSQTSRVGGWTVHRTPRPAARPPHAPAGFLNESNGDEDSLPQKDEQEDDDHFQDAENYHWNQEGAPESRSGRGKGAAGCGRAATH